MSAGLRGLRIGTGPRGSYVTASAFGVTVRQALGSPIEHPSPPSSHSQLSENDKAILKEIPSVEAGQLTDSSSASLLADISTARRSVHLFPLFLVGWIIGIGTFIGMGLHPLLLAFLTVIGIWTLWWAYRRDALRCLVPVFFDLEEPYLAAFGGLVDAMEAMRACASVWHIDARGRVRDPKYQAGASTLVKRRLIRVIFGQPSPIRTNLDIPQLVLGGRNLALFPDSMLILDGSSVGALAYPDLKIDVSSTRFIEEGAVPPDAQRVATTWKYVNKHGGPDRRFKNNRQLPVLLYEQIQIQSASGLNEVLQLSRPGTGLRLMAAIQQFRAISVLQPPQREPQR